MRRRGGRSTCCSARRQRCVIGAWVVGRVGVARLKVGLHLTAMPGTRWARAWGRRLDGSTVSRCRSAESNSSQVPGVSWHEKEGLPVLCHAVCAAVQAARLCRCQLRACHGSRVGDQGQGPRATAGGRYHRRLRRAAGAQVGLRSCTGAYWSVVTFPVVV